MAPRWLSSGQSTWGTSTRGPGGNTTLVTFAIGILIVGALLGYVVRGVTHQDPVGSVPTSALKDSAVIDPTLAGMSVGDKSPQGAVKAATSFITGFPNLALEPVAKQQAVLGSIIAANAVPTLKNDLQGALDTAGQKLLGGVPGVGAAPVTAKVIVSPASYRVDMPAKDRASVEVWFVTILVDPKTPQFSETWSTNDITLQFTDKWRIAGFAGKNGPTPQWYSVGGKPSPYNDIVPVLQDARAYRYALAR